MEFNFKFLEEHAELTLQNALLGWKLNWKLKHYEDVIEYIGILE